MIMNALLKLDIRILRVERVQDQRIAEFLQLLEGGFFIIFLNHIASVSNILHHVQATDISQYGRVEQQPTKRYSKRHQGLFKNQAEAH